MRSGRRISTNRSSPPGSSAADHRLRVAKVREWLATIRDSDDLVSVGAYVKGANPRLDQALERRDALGQFLCQQADMPCRYADALDDLSTVTAGASA